MKRRRSAQACRAGGGVGGGVTEAGGVQVARAAVALSSCRELAAATCPVSEGAALGGWGQTLRHLLVQPIFSEEKLNYNSNAYLLMDLRISVTKHKGKVTLSPTT